MLIDIRIICKSKNGRYTKEYLIKCSSCGKEEWLLGSKCSFGKKKYCSLSCINKNREHTKEWKDNLSKINYGENNPFFGKSHSKESKQMMSNSQKKIGGLIRYKKDNLSEDDFNNFYSKFCKKFEGRNNPFFGKNIQTKLGFIYLK